MMSQKQILALTAAVAGAFLQGCDDNSCEDYAFGTVDSEGKPVTVSADCAECLADNDYSSTIPTNMDERAKWYQTNIKAYEECGLDFDQCSSQDEFDSAFATYDEATAAFAGDDKAACNMCFTYQFYASTEEDECKRVKKALEECDAPLSDDYKCEA